jgi:threonylcarbamoyladenosine tRNA methylthiotransferase MtaB
MRIAFTTFGCKINQYETDGMRQATEERGDIIVPFEGDADVYVINTCSVTAKSDYQCRQAIRAAVRRRPGSRVIVTGCYAETHRDEVMNIPGVDAVIPIGEKSNILRYVGTESASSPAPGIFSPSFQTKRTRSFLKVQDGCDGRCTYCIVPLARGGSRSTSHADVLKSFDEAVSRGAPEVVLSGIHIGRYGADLSPAVSLSTLLRELAARTGSTRIRLSSIEPNEITPEIVSLLGKGLCRHLHIPLQSGSDVILRAMNRHYNAQFYRELVRDISDRVPGVAIGADVMVGFPGEGELEFRETHDLIEQLPLSHLHVFSYSPRPGTPAAVMSSQVPEKVKKQRNEQLRELGAKKNLKFRREFLGQRLSVIIEDKQDGPEGMFLGTSDNYIRVSASGALKEDVGREITIKVSNVDSGKTKGTVIRN